MKPATGSGQPSGVKRGGSPVAGGGRKNEQTRPADGRPSDRHDPTRPFNGSSKKGNHELAAVGAGKGKQGDVRDNAIKPPSAKAQDHGATHPGGSGSGNPSSPQPSNAAPSHPSNPTQNSSGDSPPATGSGGGGGKPPQKPPTGSGGSPSSFDTGGEILLNL